MTRFAPALPFLLRRAALLLALATASVPALAAPPTDGDINRLLSASRAQSMIDTMVPQIEAMQQQQFQQVAAQRQLTAQQQEQLKRIQARTSQTLRQAMSWQQLRPMYVDLYKKTFSKEDVLAMAEFYESAAGQSLLDKTPALPSNCVHLPAEQVQCLLELAVQRRTDIHVAALRMRKTQALGVQQHAVHALHAEDAVVAPIAVAGIADHVMREVLEVTADLPEAPGLRLAAQQRVARAAEFAHRHRQLASGQALEIGDRRLLHRLARPAIQIMVHPPGQLGRPASADRQVVLGHFAPHQCLAQRTGGFAVEGQQQAAAGGPVQAVHEEDRPPQLLTQAVGQEIIFATGQLAVVDHQPGRLVDHGQALIQVQQLQGRGFSLDRGEGVRFGTHRGIIVAGH